MEKVTFYTQIVQLIIAIVGSSIITIPAAGTAQSVTVTSNTSWSIS